MIQQSLSAQIKAWRGNIPAWRAAEILGMSKRTLEGIEYGRPFRYERLLVHAIKTIKIEEESK